MRIRRPPGDLLPAPLTAAGLSLIFIALALLAASPSLTGAETGPGAPAAIVTAAEGDVAVVRAVGGRVERAAFGAAILAGDQLVTGPGDRLRLLLDGRAVVALEGASRLQVGPAGEEGGAIPVRLLAGRAAVAVAGGLMPAGGRVEVRTPNAAAALGRGSLTAEHRPDGYAPGPGLAAAGGGPALLAQGAGPAGGLSNFFVAAGQATVSLLGQPPLLLGPSQGVSVSGLPERPGLGPVAGGLSPPLFPGPARSPLPGAGEPGLAGLPGQIQTATALAERILLAVPPPPVLPALGNAAAGLHGPSPTPPPPPPPPTSRLPRRPARASPAPGGSSGAAGGGGTSVIVTISTGPLINLPVGNVPVAGGLTLTGSVVGLPVGSVPILPIPLWPGGGTPISVSLATALEGVSLLSGFGPLTRLSEEASLETTGSWVDLSGGSSLMLGGGPAALLAMSGGSSLTAGDGIVRATGGSTVTVGGTGSLIRLDDALLTASAPVVALVNSTLTVHPTAVPAPGLIHLERSRMEARGGFALDNSLLSIRDVPLLSLGPGSRMTVDGDFLRLDSGSLVTVLHAPLIAVNGGSLEITGALAAFGGSGGSRLVVSNALAPTATVSGVPVRTDAGSTVSIGPTPFPGLGTHGTVSITGSALQATGGAQITITAP